MLGFSLAELLPDHYTPGKIHIKASAPQGSLEGIYFCIFQGVGGVEEADNFIHNANRLPLLSTLPSNQETLKKHEFF